MGVVGISVPVEPRGLSRAGGNFPGNAPVGPPLFSQGGVGLFQNVVVGLGGPVSPGNPALALVGPFGNLPGKFGLGPSPGTTRLPLWWGLGPSPQNPCWAPQSAWWVPPLWVSPLFGKPQGISLGYEPSPGKPQMWWEPPRAREKNAPPWPEFFPPWLGQSLGWANLAEMRAGPGKGHTF